jgi:hypothetical protein
MITRGLFWSLYLVGLVACFVAIAALLFILSELPGWQVYGSAGALPLALFTGAAVAVREK